MKKLSRHLGIFTLALVVGALLMVCSLATLSHNNEVTTGNSAQKGCNSSCTSHGQPAAISSLRDEKDEDDKEPTPPPNTFLLYQVPVYSYVITLGVIFAYFYWHRKLLLTSHLRF